VLRCGKEQPPAARCRAEGRDAERVGRSNACLFSNSKRSPN